MNHIFCAIIPYVEGLRKLRIIEGTDSCVLPHTWGHPHMLMRVHKFGVLCSNLTHLQCQTPKEGAASKENLVPAPAGC